MVQVRDSPRGDATGEILVAWGSRERKDMQSVERTDVNMGERGRTFQERGPGRAEADPE